MLCSQFDEAASHAGLLKVPRLGLWEKVVGVGFALGCLAVLGERVAEPVNEKLPEVAIYYVMHLGQTPALFEPEDAR